MSACLIVRDESDRIAGCLASLQGFADEVVVHDTGSTDDTVALARAGGARVVEGSWTDSFAEARNASLDAATGEWVLSIDADELAHADGAGLRQWLTGTDDHALLVLVRNPVVDGGHGYEYTTVKLFRRRAARWVGRVHERVVHDRVPVQPLRLVPPELLALDHRGYAAEGAAVRKGERNLRLAVLELRDRLDDRSPSVEAIALAALNLGRSAIGAGDPQQAVDAFESVRDVVTEGDVWNEATDHLARVLLGAGEPALGIVLAGQLQDAGVDPSYCSWLRAQGLAQSGDAVAALRELEGVTQIVDTAGRRHDPAALETLRGLCRELLAAPPL